MLHHLNENCWVDMGVPSQSLTQKRHKRLKYDDSCVCMQNTLGFVDMSLISVRFVSRSLVFWRRIHATSCGPQAAAQCYLANPWPFSTAWAWCGSQVVVAVLLLYLTLLGSTWLYIPDSSWLFFVLFFFFGICFPTMTVFASCILRGFLAGAAPSTSSVRSIR